MDILDKNKEISNCSIILLVHLILQTAEKRTIHPWGLSIFNSVEEIQRIERELRLNGHNLTKPQLMEILESAYDVAIKNAVTEAWGGIYTADRLAGMVDRQEIIQEAIALISHG
jgi:hypothetical protein